MASAARRRTLPLLPLLLLSLLSLLSLCVDCGDARFLREYAMTIVVSLW